MIKVKDGYAKLIGTTYQGSATQVLLSNGGDLEYSASSKASTLVQRNASQHIYATYFNSAISDEALTDIGSVYVRNTSDTFIRRVSKTQFYSILDDKFVTLDTTQSITGAKTFSTSVRFANNASIIQNQNDTSNYTTILKWYKNGASRNTYDPSIGQHNTGGDGNGSICILPYPTETSPWGGMVGLFISKGVLKLDGKSVALAENYYTKTESDERYVNVTGDTMTGPLIVKAAITGTQLISTIATGTSPLKVTSTTVVTNLNSDLLDGLHETSFFRARGDQSIASSVPTTTELATSNNLCGSWNVKYTGASGHLVQFNAGSGSTRYMQFYSMYSGSLYWRNSTDSTLNTKSWKTIVDSANYTGIVLKIGTATKGSATLPIYLNAGTPTACSTTLGVSITGNAATATKLQTARTINGTSFDGTANIVTAYWGTARTISLSGAVTGSASVNGSQNVTITTTYQFGSIDGRYVGGNKTANHGSSGTAYTADTYSSTFVNKAFVAFAERGSWAYANNGYVSTDTGVNIPLAGTAIFQWGASDTNKTQLYITPHNNSGVSNPAANEMLFYTSNGSGYTSAWTRVLTHRNYTNYTVTKTGGGASGTWGISITGNAATANRILSHTISDTLANKTTPGYLYHAGGSNSVADKPSGVDAFGVFTMQTASGWYGQILMSSNTSTGLYWRTATTLSGGWKKILDSSNYTAYINPANFVTALGTNGNYVTWTKNGTVNNLTVPYASYAAYLQSHDTRSTNNTPAQFSSGARFEFKSNSADGLSNGGSYHGILHFKPYGGTTDFSGGQTHQLGFTDSGNLYMRTSTSSSTWGSWKLILNQNTADGRYVTLTTNQTVSGIKTFSTQQKFTVATGTSPFTVSSTTVVGNLNADMVDGYHSSKLFRSFGGVSIDFNFSDDNNNNGLYYLHSNYTQSNKNGITYGSLMNFSSSASSWQIISGNDARLYYRNRWWSGGGGAWSAWKTIAYTSDIPSSLKNPYSLTLQTNGSTQTTYDGSSAKTFNVTVQNAGSGLLHNSLTIILANTTTDSGWSMINSSYNGFILKSIRTQASTPSWILGNYSAGICFGGADTKGVISCAYSTPSIRFAGGNSSKPVWWIGITGSSGVTYNLANMWTGTRYWANIAVSTASSTGTKPTFNTCYTSNWFRSTGSTGWYSESYGGGWYMTDSTWIRTYGSKSVYQNTGQIRTDGYLVTNGGITVGATSPNNGTYKSHVTGNSWSSGYIRAGAGFYHNSVNSNSYVLLAGGSYKSLADFAKGNAGASNRGVYVTNGTVTAMTYYLNATVNSGASGKLAYYSGTNSIDDYTNTIGSSSTPIYINNGIPNAANSYKVVNSGHYFSAFGISGYIYVIRYGQVVCVSINMSSGGNGSTGTTTLLTNLPSAVYTTGQSASKGGGSVLRQATFYVSGTTLYVYSYQANQLPNKVSFTYITNTLE